MDIEIGTLIVDAENLETEFKEFERRLFKLRLKYGWFHLKLNSMFHALSRASVETDFWRILDEA